MLVLATHVPLGQLVLERGIVFIDLAIAQVAGFGVVTADAMGWEPQGWSVQISAVSAALLSAAFLLWSERRMGALQEAVMLGATRGEGSQSHLRALIAWCRNGLDGGFADFQSECRAPALQALARTSAGPSAPASFLYLLLAEVGVARREAAAA